MDPLTIMAVTSAVTNTASSMSSSDSDGNKSSGATAGAGLAAIPLVGSLLSKAFQGSTPEFRERQKIRDAYWDGWRNWVARWDQVKDSGNALLQLQVMNGWLEYTQDSLRTLDQWAAQGQSWESRAKMEDIIFNITKNRQGLINQNPGVLQALAAENLRAAAATNPQAAQALLAQSQPKGTNPWMYVGVGVAVLVVVGFSYFYLKRR